MPGSEKAKRSGEYGESIVNNLLELIGWGSLSKNVTVSCTKKHHTPKNNKGEDKQCQTHGIDNIFSYKCPLRDAFRQDVIISVKCRDGYPIKEDTIRKNFKEFIIDIAWAMECYPTTGEYKNKMRNTNKRSIDGIIFWIDRNRNDDDTKYKNMIDSIGEFRITEECHYDSITLIDNNKAQRLYEVITFLNNTYGQDSVNYFYINTGLNNSSLDRVYTGKIMPLQYLASNIIPFAIKNGNENTLLIISLDNYDEEQLKRIIGLSQEITNTWSAGVRIGYPNYNSFQHDSSVINAKKAFEDKEFVEKIKVFSFRPDFRDEV